MKRLHENGVAANNKKLSVAGRKGAYKSHGLSEKKSVTVTETDVEAIEELVNEFFKQLKQFMSEFHS